MREYFKFKLKKCVLPIVLLMACVLVLYVLPLLRADFVKSLEVYDSLADILPDLQMKSLHADGLGAFLVIAAIIMAISSCTYKMSKRSCDLYYSLPLTKRQILFVHHILGFGCIMVAYTVAYILGVIIVAAKASNLNMGHYAWLYFALIIPTYIVYSLTAFFFTRANTTKDGIIFVFFVNFALPLALAAIKSLLFFVKETGIIPSNYFISTPISFILNSFTSLVVYGKLPSLSNTIVNKIIATCIYTLASAGLTFLLFYWEKNAKAENVGQISNSWFGYKVMIPLYLICLCLVSGAASFLVLILTYPIILLVGYVLVAIHKRTLKIGKKSFLLLVAYVVACLIFNTIVYYQ